MECIFVFRAQRLEAPGEIPFIYDETVSGACVYNTCRDYHSETRIAKLTRCVPGQ